MPPVPLPSAVIGSIVCTPTTAAVGESVCVEVLAPHGHSYDNTETANISINGIAGSKHYLVWNRPGTKTIHVAAGARNTLQTMKAQVQITMPADGKEPPLLSASIEPHKPTAIRLQLLNAPQRAVPPQPPRTQPSPQLPTVPPGPIKPRTVRAASAATAGTAGGIDITPPPLDLSTPPQLGGGVILPPIGEIDIPALGEVSQPVYNWDLGGKKMTTTRPCIEHDFSAQLDPRRPHTVFHIKLVVRAPGVPARVIVRSVTITNPYCLARQRGVLQPPVEQCDLSVRHADGQFRASFSVRNPESHDLTLSSMQLELMAGEEPRAFDMRANSPVQIVLKAQASTRVNVAIPAAQIPQRALAITLHYQGVDTSGLPVRVTVCLDVPQHASPNLHVNLEAQTMLTALGDAGLVANPAAISMNEALRLTQRMLLPAGVAPAGAEGARGPQLPDVLAHAVRRAGPARAAAHAALSAKDAETPQALHMEPAAPVEGAVCEPWNLPGKIPPNMVCAPTAVTKFVQLPARFMNARKGDLVLNPGDGSLISKVLASVSPPQAYSHSGIMTRNLDEITHSTAAQERLEGFIGSDGFVPDALKYMWPGVITQTVEQAVDGEFKFDPETSRLYKILDFGTLEGKMDLGGENMTVVPAMVIKPDPLKETGEIRQTLHGIADFAAQQAGKSHYRFYCYTDPRIAASDKAPASARWAANTYPTVCSSLLWLAIKQSGVPMEGGMLEQSDLAGGAQLVSSTPDGLYLYQEDERLAAAEVLHAKVHEMVLQHAGWLGEALSDAADDTANQMINAFAFDWCDGDAKDSEKWRQPGDSYAVSPANLAFYDAPLYGYMEPLIYRPARWEEVTVYEWKTQIQTGTVTGVIRLDGKPVAGAHVFLSDAQWTTSLADGSFKLEQVGAGLVIVNVSHHELHGKGSTTLAANQTAHLAIDLQQPDHLYRRLVVDGWMYTVDYEFAAAVDPYNSGDIYGIAKVGPASSSHAKKTFEMQSDDALGRLYLTFDLLPNDAVLVGTTLRCYHDGDSAENDYLEAKLIPFVVEAGHSVAANIHAFSGDKAYAEFTISNTLDAS